MSFPVVNISGIEFFLVRSRVFIFIHKKDTHLRHSAVEHSKADNCLSYTDHLSIYELGLALRLSSNRAARGSCCKTRTNTACSSSFACMTVPSSNTSSGSRSKSATNEFLRSKTRRTWSIPVVGFHFWILCKEISFDS